MNEFKLRISRPPCSSLAVLLLLLSPYAAAEEIVIDFESATIGKPTPTWKDQGVEFALAHAPQKSKAVGRVMFFPHIGTDHKGILNAMADEAIPLRATFPKPVAKVTLKLWGSTTSAAILEAYDASGKLVDREALEQVPVRSQPEELVPFFELSVEGDKIDYVQISGSQPGGFVAVDELRATLSSADATQSDSGTTNTGSKGR